MKTTFAAAVALAAALAQPAAATTFPTLTTIYVGSGLQDSGTSSINTATAVSCSNVSGQTAEIRFLILDGGLIKGDVTGTVAHGADITVATQNVNSILEALILTGELSGGTLNIESTQSGVFCTAYLIDTDASGPNGMALHLVRVNPHPGTVE
jgi:hypothetical protein